MKTKKLDRKLIFSKSTISNLSQVMAGSELVAVEKNTAICAEKSTTTIVCITVTQCQTQCPSGQTPYACQLC